MEKKKPLILGAKGMLGQALREEFEAFHNYIVTGWDREDIDLTDFEVLEKALLEENPDIVINVAAYNAVDACEEDDTEYAKALTLNVALPKFLAEKSAEMGFVLVHYSTDYVFDGAAEEGYTEEAVPHPLSRYGMSKYLGEQAVKENAQHYYLIRLSKLFGKPATSVVAKKSFFDTMLQLAKEKTELEVVDDEKSCFTYAPDLARATRALLEEEVPYGIYHLTNSGGATWFEAAEELFRLAKVDIVVKPVDGERFPRPAKRPRNSVLLNTKRPKLRPYQEALKAYIMNG